MKLIFLLLFFHHYSSAYNCDERTVTYYYRKPIYEFSMKLLDMVSQGSNEHFVSSPISAWLQLMNLAEGAYGKALRQIWEVTGRRGTACMQSALKGILNNMFGGLKNYKTLSLVLVNKNLGLFLSFKRLVEQLNIGKVLSLNFNKPYQSADETNQMIEDAVGITDTLHPFELNKTSLILADGMRFRSAWSQPFDPLSTKQESFFYEFAKEGAVNMMTQVGYFKCITIQDIHAKVVDLPCVDQRYSMLIFLPTAGTIHNIFFFMQRIKLNTLLNLFRNTNTQLLNLKLPRFRMTSELVIAGLIHDMGVTNIFNAATSELFGISEFPIQVNSMKQIIGVEVTEDGISANKEQFNNRRHRPAEHFIVNKPFAFMLVDKSSEIIIFAGIYSSPELY